MKKAVIFCLFLLFILKSNAQITLENTYSKKVYLDKFHLSGYKYVEVDISSLLIKIYNINHTLFRTISIPPQPYTIQSIGYVSENLFDLDSTMEYALTTYSSGPPPYNRVSIYNEDGSLILFRDSASIYQTSPFTTSAFYIADPISFDGVSTKMQLQVGYAASTRYEIYSLPGTIPCVDCSLGLIAGFTENGEQRKIDPKFYPNPTSDNLKLNYQLPPGAKKAFIKVYDMQGKVVQDMEVTNSFDNILLPPDYNNGLYLYSLIVDGVVIKNEKLVLLK